MIVAALLIQMAAVRFIEQSDPMSDTKTTALIIGVGGNKLVIACDADDKSLYGYIENERYLLTRRGGPVTFRFDQDKAVEGYWDQEGKRSDIASRDFAAFTRRLVTADTVRIRFHQALDGQPDLVFRFAGEAVNKRSALGRVADACIGTKAGKALKAAVVENGLALPMQ